MPKRPPKAPSSITNSPVMAAYQASRKGPETRIIGPVERLLLVEGDGAEYRDQTALHVSEMAYKSFCPRAAYFRLIGVTPPAELVAIRRQAIFEEGHDIHAKWQRWMRRMGTLYGKWKCQACDSSWMGLSPTTCMSCGAPEWKILYREVPVDRRDDCFLIGHGDGQEGGPDGPWVEIKSVGLGTVRMEAPQLVAEHTHAGVKSEHLSELHTEWVEEGYNPPSKHLVSRWFDHDALWRSIRSPFPTHLRQGHTYAGLMGVEEIIFIYEYKPTQAHKEFVVKASPHIYEPIIETALSIRDCVQKRRPPQCPHGGCADCQAYEKERDRARSQTIQATKAPGALPRTPRRPGRPEDGEAPARRGILLTPQARVGTSTVAQRSLGAGPVRPDRPDGPVHGLGRLRSR